MLSKANHKLVLKRSTSLYLKKSLPTEAASLKLDNVELEDWSTAQPFRKVPGPTRYGLIRGFMPGGDYHKKSFADYIQKAREQYGDIYRIPGMFGKEDVVMTFNLDDFRRIFRTEGIWPARPGPQSFQHYRKTYRAELYEKADGLINSQGEQWGKFRTAVNPVLMQPRTTKSYVTPMQQVNMEFLQRIREVRDPVTHEVPENFFNDINRLVFESIAVVALNTQLGLLRKNRERADAKELFTSLQTFVALTYDLEFQPSLWKYIWTPTYARFKKSLDVIFDTITGYVGEALQRIDDEKREKVVHGELSILEKLVKIDKSIAIVMAVDMLIAGVDTTSTTIAGILLEVAKHPEKQAKLRAEVRQFLPEKDSLFTIKSMNNLPYLRACIKEGMRMHPIGPGNARYAGDDLVLCGYQIPKGTQLMLNSGSLLRDDRYFPKPNEFIPERWIRDGGTEDLITPFSYLPFGFGPRMCIGKRIVDLNLEVTVARLVRNFNIEFNYPIENAFKSYFINTPVIPLKFKFTELEN